MSEFPLDVKWLETTTVAPTIAAPFRAFLAVCIELPFYRSVVAKTGLHDVRSVHSVNDETGDTDCNDASQLFHVLLPFEPRVSKL